jgi:hypothetical protein
MKDDLLLRVTKGYQVKKSFELIPDENLEEILDLPDRARIRVGAPVEMQKLDLGPP